jgi:hypothetical protein
MADIIETIDTVIGCQQCGRPLPSNSPSGDFCGEFCQRCWHAGQTGSPLIAYSEVIGVDQERFLTACRTGITDMARGFSADLVILDEAFLWSGETPPEDPKARALRLQRHRNIGPEQTQWSRRGQRTGRLK